MSNPNQFLSENIELHKIEDNNNFPTYSKEDGTFVYNDGSSMHCNTLSSPFGKLAHEKIEVSEDDLF